jgi:Domain of unknown function (DUF4253)
MIARSIPTLGTMVRTAVLCAALVIAAAPHAAAAAGEPAVVLSLHEEQLAAQINFDRDVLKIVKQEAVVPIHRLTGYDENAFQIMVNGLSVQVPHSRAEKVREALRSRLAPFACLVFFAEVDERIKRDRVGIIKGIDQFDILRIMQTNGEEEEVTNDEIIDRLRAWGRLYPFEIIGAENDWVELEFSILPKDLKAFAEEVYAFSPDTVDEGTGTIKDLILELRKTRRLVLLWN